MVQSTPSFTNTEKKIMERCLRTNGSNGQKSQDRTLYHKQASEAVPPGEAMKRGISGTQLIESHNYRAENLLLGNYMAKGETWMIYAPTGQGKTVNACMLAVALTTGGEFYGWSAHRAIPVLFVEGGELTAYGIGERMQAIYNKQGISSDENFHLKAPTKEEPFTFNITDPKHQRVLERYVDEYKIECVIFDNYNSLRSEEDSEFQSWQNLERMLNRFKTKGVASVIIHHTNKEGKQQSGAQRKSDFCDTVIRIQKSRLSTEDTVYVEVEMQKFRWGKEAPIILNKMIFKKGEIDLEPADYYETLRATIRRDVADYGITYVRKKFDYLGWRVDHYIGLSEAEQVQPSYYDVDDDNF